MLMRSRFTSAVSLTSLAIASILAPDIALAQTASSAATDPSPTPATPSQDVGPDIVVTGFRGSLARALDLKRESAAAVDSIVAEDIAKFPDNNLAESVQRIPGVAISRDGGEGRQLSVRGLGPEFTRVRLNGMEALATTSGSTGGINRGRGFDFNVFASELFNSITVRKTPSAEIDEGSLGATVDLRTSRPFDYKGFKLAGSVQGQVAEQRGRLDPRGALLFSDRFFDDRVGILLSGAYAERHTRIEGSNTGQWDFGSNNGGFKASTDPTIPLSQLNSPTLYFPRFPRYGTSLINERRLGLTAAVQVKASDTTLISFDALYARLDNDQRAKYLEAIGFSRPASQGGRPETTLTKGVIRDNKLLYGAFDGVDIRAEDYLSDNSTKFQQYNVDLVQDVGERLKVRAFGGVSKSDFNNRDTTVQMDRLNTNGYSFDYRTDPKHPTLDYGFDVTNPANWYVGPLVSPAAGATIPGSASVGSAGNQGPEIRVRPISSSNQFRTGQLDFDFEVFTGVHLKAGIQLKRYAFASSGRRMATERNIPALPAGTTVSDVTSTFEALKYLNAGGSPATWLMPDIGKFNDVYDIYSNTGFFQLFGAENASARGDIRSVIEHDRSIYIQSDYRGEVTGLPIHGDLGVRFVRTAQSATGYASVGASYAQVTVDRVYHDPLPAANLAIDIQKDLVLRLAAAKVVTRPSLSSLTPGGAVSVAGGARSVTSGNPFLDPIRARTADIALEWYFGPQSLLSIAGFYKNIGTYIQNLTEIKPFSASGLPESVLVGTGVGPTDSFSFSTPVNTPGGKLKGFEINYQQPLRFLPGPLRNLGLLLNYTYVDSDIDYIINGTTGARTRAPLVGLSKNAYNATIYYEDSRFSARASAAYRSDYLRAVPGPFNTDLSGTESTLNVDASLSYKISDAFSVNVEAINLTNEKDDTYVSSQHLTEDYRTYGRQYLAGVRFAF
jgi:iron complex outermembrane receptor protein